MPAEGDFTSDHSLPLFLSGHADEREERGSLLLLNASIFVLVASLVGMAIILSLGNPAKVFADIKASLTDISALQPGTVQSTPTVPSAPTVQSAADAQALPPTARGALTRDEIAASELAGQSQTENSEPASEALFRQFQAWAAEDGTRAQVKPVQPAQDAPAPVVENATAPVQPMQKQRARSIQDARAETLHVQKPRAKDLREQKAQVQAPHATDARAQDQSVQNAQAPSRR
jgi:hypothetical protein